MNWKPITATEPMEREEVLTRYEGEKEQRLIRCGVLWWIPGTNQYVDYIPTHYLPNEK